MQLKTNKHIKKYGPAIHLLILLGILAFIWIEVHWSVAVMMAWMAYSISTFATAMNKNRAETLIKFKALRKEMNRGANQFNQFIGTVNKQAAEFKKHGNKCVECEKYPGQIRNGSIHNSTDPNCQMHRTIDPGFQVPPEMLEEDDRPMCRKCEEEGLPDLYHHNNCPIHN